MKRISKASDKKLHFYIAKLRTLWDKETNLEVKDRIEKRYQTLIEEVKKRGIPWFWKKHSLDEEILRKGPGKFIKPNKPAWRIFTPEEIDNIEEFSLPAMVDLKIDGMRIQIHNSGKVELFSEDEGFRKAEKFKLACKEFNKLIPEGSILDAEGVIVEAGQILHRTTFIGYANGKGYEEDMDEKSEFHIFDVLFWGGKDLRDEPLEERLKYLEKVKEGKHLKPERQGKQYYICNTKKEVLEAIEKVREKKGSEGAMIKFLNGKYIRETHNKMWVKLKNLLEIDALVVEVEQPKHKKGPMEGKPVEGVYNYHVVAGPYPDKCAKAVKEKEPKKVREFKGSIYPYLGKTFNTSEKANIGDIVRIWSPEVNRYPVEGIDCFTFGIFEPKVLQAVPERHVPDSINVLMRLSEKTQPREVKKDGANAIYLPHHSCALIWSGVKNQIVKEKPFEGMLNKELYLCSQGLSWGEIELTRMYKMTREEVKEQIHRNRVFGEDWKDWEGAREFYGYDFTFEAYFEPQEVKVPKGAQTFFTLDKEEVDRIERVETSADFIGIMRKAFYSDEEDRLRFIPETDAERLEYSNRVSLAREYSKDVPDHIKAKVEKDMRKYRAQDLRRADPRFLGAKDFYRVHESKGGRSGTACGFCSEGSVYILIGREGSMSGIGIDETFNHEMGHSVFYQREGSYTDSYYARKVSDVRFGWKLERTLGYYSTSHLSGCELVAEAFSFMKKNPARAKELSAVDPDFKELFDHVQKDTGYRLIGRR